MTGSWIGRSPTHYVTKGAEVRRLKDGWFARSGNRARGPLSSLDSAMKAADELCSSASALAATRWDPLRATAEDAGRRRLDPLGGAGTAPSTIVTNLLAADRSKVIGEDFPDVGIATIPGARKVSLQGKNFARA